MAIALDSAIQGQQGGTTSLTWSHTCTGSNLVLFVCITGEDLSSTISTVTYNLVGMTLVASQTRNSGGSQGVEYLYYLVNPTTGANNVVVTGAAGKFYDAGSASYTGASQGTYSNFTNSTVTNTTITETLSGVATGSWTLLTGFVGSSGGITAGTGTTQRVNNIPFIGDSNGTVSGTVNMTYNWASSQAASGIMVEIPVFATTTTTTPTPTLSLMQVG